MNSTPIFARLKMPCHAYEDGDKIVLDAIRSDGTKKGSISKPSQWPWASSREEYVNNASKKSLWRYEVDLKSGSVSKQLLSELQCFYGVVNPKQSTQKHRYIYMSLGGLGTEVAPPQGVARFDCDTKSIDSWMPFPLALVHTSAVSLADGTTEVVHHFGLPMVGAFRDSRRTRSHHSTISQGCHASYI